MQKVKETFKKYTNNLKDYVVLVLVNSDTYQEANLEILKALITEQKVPGIYVTLNKPYRVLQRLMSQNSIDENMVIFIDAVTQTKNMETKKIPRCLFMGSPEKLSDLSLALDQAVKALNTEEKFIFFDSLNTLAIFNNPAIVARFVHFMASKMREWKVKGIIISLDKDIEQKIIDEFSQLCDAKIEFNSKLSNKKR